MQKHIFSNYSFLQTAPAFLHMIMMAAIEEEDTPELHPLACLIEEVALTPDPAHAHAQDHIPPVIVAQGLGQDLGLAQDHIPLVVAALGLDYVHGQDQDLAQMSVEGELLGGGGDRRRGR